MFYQEKHFRIRLVLVSICLLLLAVILKVFYIQVFQYKKLNTLANDLWSRQLPITADRGLILDRNGKVLASNITTTSLYIVPNQVKNKEAVAKDLADILFFGLCTDTGFFRFLNDSSQKVFEAAGRLVSYGVDPRKIYNRINSGKPYSTRKLLGNLLAKAERFLEGKLVITYESMEDTKLYGQEGRDSDALYQMLLSVKDVEAVVFLRQETVSSCTGGFRSLDKVDVSAVAAKFGGGGHKNASGMSCNGRVETLIPQIVKEFARIM